MTRSYGDKDTEKLGQRQRVRRFASFEQSALRKLRLLNNAKDLRDLHIPGLQLEKLTDNLAGYHAVRINDQFRVIFRWVDGNAEDVTIIDYH